MNTERLRRTAYTIAIILGCLILAYLTVKYVLTVVLPFLIAWAIAFVMRPPSAFISSRLNIRLKIIRPVLTVLTTAALISIIGIGVWRISIEVWQIITEFGEGDDFRSFIDSFIATGGLFDRLFGSFGASVTDVIYNVTASLLGGVWNVLSSLVASVPRVLLFVVITLIATIYFAIDLENINSAVIKLLPKSWGTALKDFKNGFMRAGAKYVRSYFLLFLMTFAIVIVGFMLLRVPYAMIFALAVSFFDLLPVIGVGTFLIPYIIFELVRGNTYLAVGLLILYAVQTVIRQFAEPKILGKNLGVHPLLTLVILYVGYALFGFVGLLLVPLFTVIAEILFAEKNSSDVVETPPAERDGK